jgi:hypothetical protein
MVDLQFVIIGEAVFGITVFDEIGTESEFQKEIDRSLNERFTDNRSIIVRALDYGHLQVGEAHPQVSRRKLARRPASHDQHIARHGALTINHLSACGYPVENTTYSRRRAGAPSPAVGSVASKPYAGGFQTTPQRPPDAASRKGIERNRQVHKLPPQADVGYGRASAPCGIAAIGFRCPPGKKRRRTHSCQTRLRPVSPPRRATKKRTRKIKNRTLAIPAAATAIPAKPKIAAMTAMMKNAIAQRSILFLHGLGSHLQPSATSAPADLDLAVSAFQYAESGIFRL